LPHFIIEYSQDLLDDKQIPEMLDAVHNAAMETGLFIESHIKTRAIPVQFYRIGTGHERFIHAQLRIKIGRNIEQKKLLSAAVLNAIKRIGCDVKVITVEVVDMDSECYAKATY